MEKERRAMGTHRAYRERRYEFGKQLLTLRTRAALTQIELAEQIGLHRRSVQNWEVGESYPKAETLQRMIAVFLSHHAFTEGHERAEAHALWEQAAEDGLHPLASFDDVWFARTLAIGAASTLRVQMGAPVRPVDRPVVEHALATARSTLGADAFAAVWGAAGELPLEQLLNTIIPSAAPFDALPSTLTTQLLPPLLD